MSTQKNVPSKEDLEAMKDISDCSRMRRAGYGPNGPSPRPPVQSPPLLFRILNKIFS